MQGDTPLVLDHSESRALMFARKQSSTGEMIHE